ncbi:GNAT family N-acetyltransferase [Falsiroseomonas sp.]|uniref:GNAT family N-acetyltransferase n=1 Tax=Falsiroseomonas sp. TaxID=2870721 RepID=UPI003564DB64
MQVGGTRLVRPAAEHLPGYADALRRGFEPSTYAGPALAAAHLAAIEHDPAAFLAGLEDVEGRGAVTLPDGSEVPRLPGFTRWILDRGFCGVIHARWQTGSTGLPAHLLGHVGYLVVAWRRGEGQATRALGLLLPELAQLGLPWVELVTDPANAASIRVIEANGGTFLERFTKLPAHGGTEALRFRIALGQPGRG